MRQTNGRTSRSKTLEECTHRDTADAAQGEYVGRGSPSSLAFNYPENESQTVSKGSSPSSAVTNHLLSPLTAVQAIGLPYFDVDTYTHISHFSFLDLLVNFLTFHPCKKVQYLHDLIIHEMLREKERQCNTTQLAQGKEKTASGRIHGIHYMYSP